MSIDFTPIDDVTGPGEARSNADVLAAMFPDAMVDGRVDLDVLRDLLGEDAEPAGSEAFGLRWPGMSEARRLSTLPPTSTLLPRPDESVDWDTTKNIVIEGDNLEVLRLLRRGYTNKVDVIYIDPPYNTGNDFVYDDSLKSTIAEYEVDAGLRDADGATQVGEGSDRAQDRRSGAAGHAKWLSMMYPRLLVAHQLLKESGVLIAAIDDKEHARFKLLLDRVFGAENFIANVTWQGVKKNDSRYVSDSHDYMLIYAKSEAMLSNLNARWRVRKPYVDEAFKAAEVAWRNSNENAELATSFMKNWFSSQRGKFSAAISNYNLIDSAGRLYMRSDLRSPQPRENLKYDLLHPTTGYPVRRHPNGWVYSRETMDEQLAAGRIIFGQDHTTLAYYKRYLDEQMEEVALSVFEQPRRSASQALETLLGGKFFDFPKDVDVLARWIDLVTQSNPDATVLDFFAGSGSTGHAVINLNALDGGYRRYILVQLNEATKMSNYGTIADITRERLRRAALQVLAQHKQAADTDTGFMSYRLTSSNVRSWDGSADQLDLLAAAENLVEGRTTDDLLVEMMLRLGIELTAPIERCEVAGSTLYSVGGTLYAYFGIDVTTERSDDIARALVAWRDENQVDSDVTVVVRDTGFVDSSAKLNLAAALSQAGITTLRSI